MIVVSLGDTFHFANRALEANSAGQRGDLEERPDHVAALHHDLAAQVRAHTGRMEPDPEVPERSRPPRTYPAAYKLRILGEYEQLDKAGKGALLRREGLY